MSVFVVGDKVSFRDEPRRIVTITKVSEPYVYFDHFGGGYYPSRFVLMSPAAREHIYMDAGEYDDILAGQEIYSKLEGK